MADPAQVQYFNEPLERQLGFAASVFAGHTLHLSGIVAVDERLQIVGPNDMAAQITRVYDIMEIVLARSGATLKHVVNELVFVTDIAALAAAADVRTRRYAAVAPPCSTAVQVGALFIPGAMIEIQATAFLGRAQL